MPKVVITPRSYGLYSPLIWERWEAAGFHVTVEAGPLSESKLSELLAEADALLVGTDTVSKQVLVSAPNLKVISKYGVGVDNIETDYTQNNGIQVYNTPGVNTEAVADYTWGLILSLARRIPQSHTDLVQGKWKKRVGFEVYGKTIGILGLGAIGKAVAKRATGFNMQVLAYDAFPDRSFAEAHGIQLAELKFVLSGSDIITIHTALTPETYHFIGEKELSWMKREAMLINTARGGILDERALYDALIHHRISGAALDVFQTEPLASSPLCELDQVILTPHNASASVEAIKRMTERSTDHILQFFEREKEVCSS
ncbi:phosphoglycerate dehydrogenase [Paenibacillus sp. N3.4]|uniref:phosphoglycerate dehydrogenase n=1 Tax=Paenibacillus sp. N3.4 TaxID=2603222 RepID=UPI00165099DA|nr:phosphoglycerate dehydrogenase [Paenibacillus sp. N3.4]